MILRGKLKWFDLQREFGFVVVDRIGDVLIDKHSFGDARSQPAENYERNKALLVPGAIVEFFAIYKVRAENARILTKEEAERAVDT